MSASQACLLWLTCGVVCVCLPVAQMLNLGHMWTSLDGDERSLVPHAASSTTQQQPEQPQSVAAGSWVSGGVMRPRPSPRQLGMMMAAVQGERSRRGASRCC